MTEYQVEVEVPDVVYTDQGTLPKTNGETRWAFLGPVTGDWEEAWINYDHLAGQGIHARIVRFGSSVVRDWRDEIYPDASPIFDQVVKEHRIAAPSLRDRVRHFLHHDQESQYFGDEEPGIPGSEPAAEQHAFATGLPGPIVAHMDLPTATEHRAREGAIDEVADSLPTSPRPATLIADTSRNGAPAVTSQVLYPGDPGYFEAMRATIEHRHQDGVRITRSAQANS